MCHIHPCNEWEREVYPSRLFIKGTAVEFEETEEFTTISGLH